MNYVEEVLYRPLHASICCAFRAAQRQLPCNPTCDAGKLLLLPFGLRCGSDSQGVDIVSFFFAHKMTENTNRPDLSYLRLRLRANKRKYAKECTG
jgi:hypothetical protein